MHSSAIRWTGLPLILGGLYAFAFGLPHVLGAVVILVGLIGLYALQARTIAWLGFAGLVITSIGLVCFASIEAALWLSLDWKLRPIIWLSLGTLVLGLGLFGLATNRAGVLPRHTGSGLIFAAALIPVAGAFMFGIYLALLGYLVLSGRYTVGPEPAQADSKGIAERPVIIQTFVKPDNTRKVEIFQHADQTFGFTELGCDQDGAWYPCDHDSYGHIDTLQNTVEEAKGRVPWLSKQLSAE